MSHGQSVSHRPISRLTLDSAYSEIDNADSLKHSLCLGVTADSFASVLIPPGGSPKSTSSKREKPFVVAVADLGAEQSQHSRNEGQEWSGDFKVAVDCLITDFFSIIGNQILTPFELGGAYLRDEVWCGI